MKYHNEVNLRDGKVCVLRNGTWEDGRDVYENFNLTHGQTDYLLSYPDENSFTAEQEGQFLNEKSESDDEIEILAVVDGVVAGTAGIERVGTKYKVRHRAEFGISIDRKYWGLGIGRALTNACIECARNAGYTQLELDVVSDNHSAVELYKSVGFKEYGRNPKGFKSRASGWQELVLMRLELD